MHQVKCWGRWSTSWNHDCWEKYQPQICIWCHPYGRKQRGTKEPLDENERGEWKSLLKTQIKKTKIMASGPISTWLMGGETVTGFLGGAAIFLGCNLTMDVDCSHEIKRLAPWKKSNNKPRQHIKKQRRSFANNGLYIQCYSFPVVMYGCEWNESESR